MVPLAWLYLHFLILRPAKALVRACRYASRARRYTFFLRPQNPLVMLYSFFSLLRLALDPFTRIECHSSVLFLVKRAPASCVGHNLLYVRLNSCRKDTFSPKWAKPFRVLRRKKVGAAALFEGDLACSGNLKTFFCGGVGFHLGHCIVPPLAFISLW